MNIPTADLQALHLDLHNIFVANGWVPDSDMRARLYLKQNTVYTQAEIDYIVDTWES